jgi:hypothetical protein
LIRGCAGKKLQDLKEYLCKSEIRAMQAPFWQDTSRNGLSSQEVCSPNQVQFTIDEQQQQQTTTTTTTTD